MKLAIMANEKDSFVRPLAEGLSRMAERCGATAEIHYDGLAKLSLPVSMSWRSPRAAVGRALRLTRNRRLLNKFVEQIRGADVVVVVAHVPSSLAHGSMPNVEVIRRMMPDCPIVNYDLVYLPTVEKWGVAMLRGEPTGLGEADLRAFSGGSFGMERYDWYLVGSPTSEMPMPPGPQPLSHIGIDIDDGSLYPDQGDTFRVLVDFEQRRKDYPRYRDVQIRALQKSGIPFSVLDGRLSRDDIRAIYRKTGAFMMAHRESFGLPVCELQACGSLIFTPHPEWAGAHWIKRDLTVAGPGSHSPNFVVYENDVGALVDLLHAAREAFDPPRVVRTFRQSHRQLFRGDTEALAGFLTMVHEGTIHARSHLRHAGIGK